MAGNQTPPLKETLQAGVRDYNAANTMWRGRVPGRDPLLSAGRDGRNGAVLPGEIAYHQNSTMMR